MKATVDPGLCDGCGYCVAICPGVFQKEGSLAVVTTETVPPDAKAACHAASIDCGVGAIALEE